jgi:uncharacterized protein YcbK (DUF882 family)
LVSWTLAAVAASTLSSPLGVDAPTPTSAGLARRKVSLSDSSPSPPLLGTLVQTHTAERLMLDASSPSAERFDALLADRVTGASHPLAPELLALLRGIAEHHPGARIELVSGYRSWKLNEMLRKKGHHVASHSQHSLGQAVDFRVVLDGDARGLDPRSLEKEVRDLGWKGGTGVYTLETDWFIHADVGPERRWHG